jgi:hypothetical protein
VVTALSRRHAVVESKNPALLYDLLADEVVFRSPAVFAPQEGKALTSSYLTPALKVLGPSLRYVGQWSSVAPQRPQRPPSILMRRARRAAFNAWYLEHLLAEVGDGRKGRPSRGKLCQQAI